MCAREGVLVLVQCCYGVSGQERFLPWKWLAHLGWVVKDRCRVPKDPSQGVPSTVESALLQRQERILVDMRALLVIGKEL